MEVIWSGVDCGERSNPVRKLQAMKCASTPSSPVCFRCGNRGHVARYCQNSPLCFACNRLGHRSFQCRAQCIVDPPLDIPSTLNATAHMESVTHTSRVKEVLENVDSAVVSVKSLLCADTDEMTAKIVTMEVQQEKIERVTGTGVAMEIENGGLSLVCAKPVQSDAVELESGGLSLACAKPVQSAGKNNLQIHEKSVSGKAVAIVFQQEEAAHVPSVVSGNVNRDGASKDQGMEDDKQPDPNYAVSSQQLQDAGTGTFVDKLDNKNTHKVASGDELEGAQKEKAKKGSVYTETKRSIGSKLKAMRKLPKHTSDEESNSSNCTQMIEDVYDI